MNNVLFNFTEKVGFLYMNQHERFSRQNLVKTQEGFDYTECSVDIKK